MELSKGSQDIIEALEYIGKVHLILDALSVNKAFAIDYPSLTTKTIITRNKRYTGEFSKRAHEVYDWLADLLPINNVTSSPIHPSDLEERRREIEEVEKDILEYLNKKMC